MLITNFIMKNHKNASRESLLKISLIIPMSLAFILSVNAQPKSTSTKFVSDLAKDSVNITKKQVVQAPVDNTVLNSKPIINQTDKDKIYTVIEKMPQFPGGETELLKYIGKNLKYPVEAQQKGIQGRIIVRFVVNKTGKVENAEVIRGLYPAIDKEGLRVINSLPDWVPGEQKGEKVSVWYTLPITFKLTNDAKSSNFDPKKMPVFVMDGKVLPIGYNINTINKDSIQSVDVLKPDTEAKKAELISKYGERAVNGVIIITMKKQIQ
jgi:TonB family protein